MYLASTPSPVKNLKLTQTQAGVYEASWDASPEKSVRSYVVSFGPEKGQRKEVKVTASKLGALGLKAGDVVMVKAVNARGYQGWDWTKVTVN